MVKASTVCASAGFFADAVMGLPEGGARVDIDGRRYRSGIAKPFGWALVAALVVLAFEGAALADPLALAEPTPRQGLTFNEVLRDRGASPNKDTRGFANIAVDQHRALVSYSTGEAPGTIIIDTPHTYLYYIVGGGKALRYGIGVGREGFTWSGVQAITRKAEWPDWSPPAEMLNRQPYLPRVMAGGPGNPLGARALYLGETAYRIHGTNQPNTIGRHVSSGCIRMLNEDVIDLYARVDVGTKVIVLADEPQRVLDQAVADRSSRADRRRASTLY